MKKAISIILAAGLIPWAIPAHAADMEIKSILDPVEKIIMINGNLSSGPDGIISVSVSDEAGTTVFADELISGEDGEFRTSFDVGGFLDGKYTASFKSSDSEAATYSFVLPAEATAAEKLRISADKNVLLIKNGAPDEEYSQIVLTVENAKLMRGNLSSEDFSVQGLPAGYTLEGKVTEENKIIFTLKGAGAVNKSHEVKIALKSTVINGGSANTGSDEIAVTIYSEDEGKTVKTDKYSLTAYMRDETEIDSTGSSVEIAVQIRALAKDGLLTEGTDYELILPSELSGLKCTAAANKAAGKIKLTFSGTLASALSADSKFSLVIKSACVTGAEADSAPISIEVKKAEESGSVSGSGTGSSTGSGGGSGGGYTGGGGNVVNIAPTVPAREVSFEDISGHWAEKEILRLAGDGYVSGVGGGCFSPNRNISRAEFVTMATRAFDLGSGEYNGEFADVEKGAWYSGYVAAALSSGIISADVNFRPNDPIKREEMTKVVVAAWLTKNERPEWINVAQFGDRDQISDWAADYVDLAVTLGLVKGDNQNMFNPKKSATRAEAAAIFYRMLYLN